MSILLSLVVAAIFGTADFFGGLSAKRVTAAQVVAGSHIIGLVGVVIAAILIENTFTFEAFGLGMVSGAFGAMGVMLLYRGLSRGPMSIIAPITAVTSAAVPAAFGVATGDRFGALGWFGVALAFVAIALTSITTGDDDAQLTTRVLTEALMSGVGFGLFFIFLDLTEADAAPWPVVGARLLSAVAVSAFLISKGKSLIPPDRPSATLITLTGICDTGSNVLFLYALQLGDLTTVSVLTALYPIATIILARQVLNERMSRVQISGVAVALVATVMIAAG